MKPYASFVPEKFDSFPVHQYLSTRFPYHTIEEWTDLILTGSVSINGNLARELQILTKGDEVSYLPKGSTHREPPINADFSILYESDCFLVVNKPPNIPVHPAGRYRTHTLLNLLENERGIGTCYPVHRLDRETSGVMLFAKNKEYQLLLQSLFETREVKKVYEVFVFGKLKDSVIAEGFIGRDSKSEIRKKQKFAKEFFDQSKVCFTEFQNLGYDTEKDTSHLLAKPSTGRIHQIRATLYSLGFPVVGDKLYGKRESAFLDFVKLGESETLSIELGHNRQALHAKEISFFDPIAQKEFLFVAPLTKDLCHLSKAAD
ncbi:MAG: RluA family pseudouridine synthase [Leptospira sp.]|nr:RluA family pseudouridine synthase [Leptospira sp.]